MDQERDLYFVAVKMFLTDEAGRLLITKDRFGDWDIPGGRLKEDDFLTSLEKVAEHKIIKELGDDFRCQLGQPLVFMRHERNEILASGEKAKRRIFAIGYEAKYLGGEIKLDVNHERYEWVNPKTFNPADYFTGGWLAGVKNYIDIVKTRQIEV